MSTDQQQQQYSILLRTANYLVLLRAGLQRVLAVARSGRVHRRNLAVGVIALLRGGTGASGAVGGEGDGNPGCAVSSSKQVILTGGNSERRELVTCSQFYSFKNHSYLHQFVR